MRVAAIAGYRYNNLNAGFIIPSWVTAEHYFAAIVATSSVRGTPSWSGITDTASISECQQTATANMAASTFRGHFSNDDGGKTLLLANGGSGSQRLTGAMVIARASGLPSYSASMRTSYGAMPTLDSSADIVAELGAFRSTTGGVNASNQFPSGMVGGPTGNTSNGVNPFVEAATAFDPTGGTGGGTSANRDSITVNQVMFFTFGFPAAPSNVSVWNGIALVDADAFIWDGTILIPSDFDMIST